MQANTEPAKTKATELNSGFASRDSVLGHEWSVTEDAQLPFQSTESSDFHAMNAIPSRQEEDSFDGMFFFPGTF
jgi:hypothetical protein